MSSSLKQRQPAAAAGEDATVSPHYDPLAVLDESGDAEPLDTAGEHLRDGKGERIRDPLQYH